MPGTTRGPYAGLVPDVGRPSPEEYQPPLTPWSHTWRALLMVVVSGFVWATIAQRMTPERFALDVALGVPAVALVWFRRRRPMTVAVLTLLCSAGSATAAGPAALASVSLSSRRVWPQVVAIGLLNVGVATVFLRVHPAQETQTWWVALGTNIAFTAGMLAVGMYLGSRRELLWTLRARAERAEAEQELRAGQSRLEERGRIAREMHDVLAHRISQISMRAGALAYRDDLPPDDLREGVGVIRDAANQALDDLRGVLGVLRDGEGVLHAPQPTYADLDELVDEARRAGLRVDWTADVGDEPVPDATGRTLYRVVQEGITNARKHAPGAEVSIALHGSPDAGIDVAVLNPLGFGPSAAPGAGLGLVGLAERAELAGGRIEHRAVGGRFELRCWIPWAA
ncbi:MAG: histidine kinase, dimerization and phosphoacceptor region [Nocardioides sp.]|nr:histidine kinase, dimerization and phosphoacceptor region [Nocardioides sp.]